MRKAVLSFAAFTVSMMMLGIVVAGFAAGQIQIQNGTFAFNMVSGPTCANPVITIKDPNTGGLVEIQPLAISYTLSVYHIHGSPTGPHFYTVETHSTCYKMVVNAGFDQLSILDGNNKTGGPVYMAVSTQSGAPGAGDTVCGAGAGAYITNGFSIANALSTYAHSGGTSTYTINHTWTYSGSGAVVLATACLQSHSSATAGSAAATALVDESNLSPTATVNNNGDQVVLTATVTV